MSMIEEIKYTDEVIEDVTFDYKKHLVDLSNVNKGLTDYFTGKIKQGYSTGIEILDNYFAFKEKEFYILTGKKGSGKTTIYQSLQLMASINNGLKWAVCYQENDNVFMKLNLMNYLLSDYAKNVYLKDKLMYDKASKFIDEHFIFLEVDSIKQALDVTKGLLEDGINIHGVLLDPINSFENGYVSTGNNYSDGVVAGLEILKFTKKYCSVHISQHPTMSGQRQEGAVTSYQGEGGWYLNKASFTCVIHREKGTSENCLIVENVRNKHTGGSETETDNAPIIYWSPTKINVYMQNGMGDKVNDVFKKLTNRKRIFGVEILEDKKEMPNISPLDAFSEEMY